MLKLGYKLMSEEHGPKDLVANAQRAEAAGFDFAAISDHFFPWMPRPAGLVGTGRRCPDHTAPRPYDRGYLSQHALPPGDHRPGRCHVGVAQ
jgi:alkanesulfonate monooxygenase SsuD/methylene tetrahydromethanopterin reductase-like flavin-dependent oxidoreductase (luciferase family)